jgi:hypothetical protein
MVLGFWTSSKPRRFISDNSGVLDPRKIPLALDAVVRRCSFADEIARGIRGLVVFRY